MSGDLPAKELLSVGLEISRKRGRLLDRMRDALLQGDNEEARRCAKELCGLTDDDIRKAEQKKGKQAKSPKG